MNMSVESCIFFQIILLLLLIIKSTCGHCYTRWPSCGIEENVVCLTNYGEPAANCKIIYGEPEFRKAVVERHNYYRNNVAIGNETRGGFKHIADMLAMSYDSDLEFTAQCQAARCIYDHDVPCYITSNFSEVGQNLNGRIYEQENNHTFDSVEDTKNMISEWYEYEITESNAKIFEDFSRIKVILNGYLYQMIWAESHRIGCGRSISEKKYYMMICNYGPRGLRVTKPLGRLGRPCTKCPEEMSCNTVYKGLCGEIDESHYHITVSGATDAYSSAVYLWVIIFCFVVIRKPTQ